MAKKQEIENNSSEESQRQSRKDILLARKQQQQLKWIRIGILAIVAVIAIVILIAVVNELIISPGRAVATVNGQSISLREWQERVEWERAQRIVGLENQLEAFGGDVGTVQQFAGQSILELQDAEGLGQAVLDRMVEELIIQQEAEKRGVSVSDAEIEEEIEASFNYFGGDSPTPVPMPTETIQPTPSITLIPTEVITDVVPVETALPTPTEGPPPTPFPTATAVSLESFQEEFDTYISQFTELGVNADILNDLVRIQLLQTSLTDIVAEEQSVADEAMQASIYVIFFDNQEEAEAAHDEITNSDFLTVWNTIRSRPFDPEDENSSTANATEYSWRTQEALAGIIGDEAANLAFDLPLEVPGTVVELPNPSGGDPFYLILMPNGREVRPLTEQEYDDLKFATLSLLVSDILSSDAVDISEFWRDRSPSSPVLNNKFLAPPTPTPFAPADDGAGAIEEGQ